MRWFISFILLFFVNICFAQNVSIKHIEIISEIRDSMLLINIEDANKINKIFHEYSKLDSINQINSEIIESLIVKNKYLDSLILNHKKIVNNYERINLELNNCINKKESYYEKQLLKARREKIGWQSATGISLLITLIILLL